MINKTQENKMNTYQEFANYCYDFYGKNGTFELNYTRKQIAAGIYSYLLKLNDDITWGGGDSIDRERVRIEMQKLFPEVENLAEVAFNNFKVKGIL